MKVKFDDYYMNVLINGLYSQSESYDEETYHQINILLLRLVNISDTIKPNREKKITFEPEETSLIIHCLADWLNNQIRAEKLTAAEVIGELLIKFTG